MTYIATFHTHFAAVSFARLLKAFPEMKPQFMPVPRKLSSSCGTCVKFEAASPEAVQSDDLEQLFLVNGEELTMLQSNI